MTKTAANTPCECGRGPHVTKQNNGCVDCRALQATPGGPSRRHIQAHKPRDCNPNNEVRGLSSIHRETSLSQLLGVHFTHFLYDSRTYNEDPNTQTFEKILERYTYQETQ